MKNNSHGNHLIPVFTGEINKTEQPLCDARELHTFLGLKSQFGNWIGVRIKQYRFMENVDFALFNKAIKNLSSGGRPSKEYHLTLDMAKELAMVERNDKGREARQYFIDCERQVLNEIANNLGTGQSLTLQTLALENTDILEQLEHQQIEIEYLQQSLAGKDELLELYRYKIEIQAQQIPQPKPPRKKKRHLTAEDVEAIHSLRSEGLSLTDIAKTVDCSTTAIHYLLKGAKTGEDR